MCARAQSYPTLCDSTDSSLPGSSVHGFSRQEYVGGLPCPSPGNLPHPGIERESLHLLRWQAGSLPLSRLGSPRAAYHHSVSLIPKRRPIPAYSSRFSVYVDYQGFPGGTSGEEPPASAGDIRDLGSVPGWGRSPGGGHGHPLQYSCLENPMHRGAWQATGRGVAKSQTRL